MDCHRYFFLSLITSTGALNPRASFAYDAPPKDQGHTGPNPDDPPPNEPPEDPCQATGQNSPGSPVHLKAGNYFYSNQDLLIPGRGFSLQIVRDYDSQNEHEGPFGYGWSFQLLMELIRVTEGDEDYAVVRRGDGVRLKFKDNGDGTFTPPAGRYDTLVQNADGSYDLMKKTGTCSSCAETAHFDTGGHLLYKRDGNGNQVSFSYDGTGRVATVTDASVRQLTFSYGTNNKISKVTDPAGREFSYTYDAAGNLVSYSDPLGNTTTYAYDDHHNLTSIMDPRGNTLHTITYDGNGNLLTVTDANGNTTTNTYGALNRVTRTTYPDSAFETVTYDAVGNITGITDRNGNTVNKTYDALNRLLAITYPDSTVTNYTYDLNGIILTAGNADISYAISYDALNRVIQVNNVTLGKNVSYSYLCCGLKDSMTNPEGGVTSYTHDALKRMTSLTNSFGETTAYTYDNLSRVTRKD
jgi:YD repeat-containing protein